MTYIYGMLVQVSNRFLIIEKWEDLQYPFTRRILPGYIQDIQDRKKYKDLQRPGGFLSVPENTGLIMCSDGVQLFKSSQHSFWPILLAVTSLPPGIRMNAENLILAGIWQGPSKPLMKIILAPVLKKIRSLHDKGIAFESPVGPRVKMLTAVFDLPAKATATEFVQFNGYYSCNYCLDKGKQTNHRHIFMPDEKHEVRTTNSISVDVDISNAEKKGKPVNGVKGKSILSDRLNLPEDVVIDYMHAVLEGVSKSLSALFDSKCHKYRFYLGKQTKQVNERLLKIKPPEELRRSPRITILCKVLESIRTPCMATLLLLACCKGHFASRLYLPFTSDISFAHSFGRHVTIMSVRHTNYYYYIFSLFQHFTFLRCVQQICTVSFIYLVLLITGALYGVIHALDLRAWTPS